MAQQHPRPHIPTRIRAGTPPEWCNSHFKLPERNQYQRMGKRNCDQTWHLVGVSPGLEHPAGMLGREKGLGLCLCSLPVGMQHPSALGVQLRGSSPPCTLQRSWHRKTAQERGLCGSLNTSSFLPGCSLNWELGRQEGTWTELQRVNHRGAVWGVQHPTAQQQGLVAEGRSHRGNHHPARYAEPSLILLSMVGTFNCPQHPSYPGSAQPRHFGSCGVSRGDIILQVFSWLVRLAPTPWPIRPTVRSVGGFCIVEPCVTRGAWDTGTCACPLPLWLPLQL